MSSDKQSVDEKALHRQLYELRREGFEGAELVKQPDLTMIALRLAPGESELQRQIEVSIELAIEDLPQDQEVARLWFGLHPDTRGKDKDEREKKAADARYVSVPAFRSHTQKPLIVGIRRALLERYEPSAELEPADEPDALPRRPFFFHLRGGVYWPRLVEEFSVRAGRWS